MSDQQDYEKLKPSLDGVLVNEVRFPDMPVEQAAAEGQIMSEAAFQDADRLLAVGVTRERLDELAASVGALRHTQALLVAAIGERKEAEAEFGKLEPEGFELRADMLAAQTYALKNIPDAVQALKRVREGSSKADEILDLGALAQIGKKYRAQMEAINYDMSRFDTALSLAAELNKLYAKAFIEKGTKGPKDQRDRAFTYMRKLMGEILDAAEYALRKDPARLDFYYSAYRSRRRAAAEPAVETPATTTSAPALAT